MTRIQKIREDIFQLQCLDRETSIVSVDDLEWTLRQLQVAEALVRALSDLTRAGTTPGASNDGDDGDSDGRRAGNGRSAGDGRSGGNGRSGGDGDGDEDRDGDGDGDHDGDGAKPHAVAQRASILLRADAFLRDLSTELSLAAPRT